MAHSFSVAWPSSMRYFTTCSFVACFLILEVGVLALNTDLVFVSTEHAHLSMWIDLSLSAMSTTGTKHIVMFRLS